MYELNIPIDNTKSNLLEYELVDRRIKKEIIQWCSDHNMNIRFKSQLNYINFYEFNGKSGSITKELNGDLTQFYFTILQGLRSLTLIFNTVEDRNLFRLTWG